jgi:hypothetical protein
MPFKSKAQMKYMYAKHPKIAKKWSEEYGQSMSKLPNKLKSTTKSLRKKYKVK